MISGMNRPSVRILAIESSCDETAVVVVVDGRRILSNVVASQIELHQQFGGVFPELASRQFEKASIPMMSPSATGANLTVDNDVFNRLVFQTLANPVRV